jgi:hypothetical protein
MIWFNFVLNVMDLVVELQFQFQIGLNGPFS